MRVVLETLCMTITMAPEASVASEKIILPFVIAVFIKMAHGTTLLVWIYKYAIYVFIYAVLF